MAKFYHAFSYETFDGTEWQVELDDLEILFDGNGWDEPETVSVEDYDIIVEGVAVRCMNGGIITRTLPLPHEEVQPFLDRCQREAETFAQNADPSEAHDFDDEPDYDYSY